MQKGRCRRQRGGLASFCVYCGFAKAGTKNWYGRGAGWPWDRTVAHVAQLVEHVLGKDEVIGSNPIVGSRKQMQFIKFVESGLEDAPSKVGN